MMMFWKSSQFIKILTCNIAEAQRMREPESEMERRSGILVIGLS